MPAVVVGAASIWGGVTAWGVAGTSVLAYVSAGAMVVGGAMSVYGGVTGNEKLANDGMMIGAIGSLGTMAFGGTAKVAATGSMESSLPGGTAGVEGATPAATGAKVSPEATTVTGDTSAAVEATKKYSDATDRLMAMQQQNTLMQTASGAITGFYQNEATQEQNKLMQDKLNYERAQEARRVRNLNPLAPVQLPKVSLPRNVGIISPAAAPQPVSGQPLTTRYAGA